MIKRNKRKYQTRKIRTKRLENSAIPYMTNLLNIAESKKLKMINNDISVIVPVNFNLL